MSDIAKYIDWTPFFQTWDLAGKFPAILDDEVVGVEARKVFEDAKVLLDKLIKGQWLQADAVVAFYPANTIGDDIVLYSDEARQHPLFVWHNLRQQAERPVVDGVRRPNRCLADYVAPKDSGVADYLGCFAVTTGHGVEKKVAEFQAKHDDYSAIMLKALADRLAEAFAELMHHRVRTDLWGYATDEILTNDQMIDEQYRGIRPAPGYPACPAHEVKEDLLRVIGSEDIGMTLTESMAMNPASSVSGFYLAHPDARYFNVGKISTDQLEDLAKRRGQSIEDARRQLASLID
jgi:5-methyltetrahydrofolate--homocysteine methyltransferase